MNLGDLNLNSVNYNHPQLNHSTSRHSIAASNADLTQSEADYAADNESVTTAETVVHWSTPPSIGNRSRVNSYSESTEKPIQVTRETDLPATRNSMDLRHSEQHISSTAARASERPILDEFNSAPPTPNMDDTPYIRYAIDTLTRDEGQKRSQRRRSINSEDSYPVERIIPDEGLGYVQSQGLGYAQSVKKVKGPALVDIRPNSAKSELFIPVEPQFHSPRHPDLTFLPPILRPFSIMILILLCLSMIVVLMFCAIYSATHRGLVAYAGGLSGGQYFLFQFVPQILAAILLLYIEGIVTAVTRIVPFTMMASDNSRSRANALFIDLYSKGMFWPRFDYLSSGEILLGLCSLLLWPVVFTIPLQSSLFSVINVDGVWRWTVVQGVVWTLIAIYISSIIALALIGFYFFRRFTGLIWDPRSLADIIALLPRSNNLDEYIGMETSSTKQQLRTRLAVSSERLGYWRTNDALQEIFYCIGEEGAPTRRYTIQDGKAEKISHVPENDQRRLIDVEGRSSYQLAQPEMRFRYIPWYLNDAMVLLWPIAGFFLILALLIVSFLPSTALDNGFLPLVPAAPNSEGFSSANFLYSFVPSTLGLLIYLVFRSLSLMLYQLSPWAALSSLDGAIASESILLDYTASLPFLTALTNGHTLIALISIIAPLTILLPILAGGLFFPIQFIPSNVVMMLTNLPAFYIIIVVLILAEIGLIAIAVSLLGTGKRKRYHLPHPVSCLAEIISFVYASDLIHDAAFRAVRGKADLRARLIGRRERSSRVFGPEEVRYAFGVFKSRDGANRLGINMLRRMKRKEWLSTGGRDFERSRSKFSY